VTSEPLGPRTSHPNEQIAEWRDVDAATFRERIYPTNEPAALRGIVEQWPAVIRGSSSAQAMCDYLLSLPQGRPVPMVTADPSVRGRFFFRDDMRVPNFQRNTAPLAAGLQALLTHLDNPAPPALFIESAPLSDCLPSFVVANSLKLLNPSIAPRIWIGNSVTVQTHYDFSNNIACTLAGRRRFTLFPPEQLPNLYPGPMDITLAGVPVSMVPLHQPDFVRYPRFRRALAAARRIELNPGDGLFIPYGWWHHVESLTPFNVLVNYWWTESTPVISPLDCLLHGVLALRDMPAAERAVWRNLFDYYVFQTSGDPLLHLAPALRGLMGAPTPELYRQVKAILLRSLADSR
jgi:Cupin-like domain